MSHEANTTQKSAAPVATMIKFKDMNVLQKLVYVGKTFVCILSFGFAFPHIFSDF